MPPEASVTDTPQRQLKEGDCQERGAIVGENTEEALRRQTVIRVMGLTFAGMGRCARCHQRADIFSKRRTTPGQGKERCLDCWRAER